MNMRQSNKDGIEFVLVVGLILTVVTYFHLHRFWIAAALLVYLLTSSGYAIWSVKRMRNKKARSQQV